MAVVVTPALLVAACGSASKPPPPLAAPTVDCAGAVTASPTAAPTTERSAWPVFQHDARHTSSAAIAGPTTGAVRWTRRLEGPIEQSAVVGSDGTIYAFSDGGVLHALDPASGADRWSFDGGGRYAEHLASAAAVLADGSVLWPGPLNTLHDLDAAGHERWRRRFDSPLTAPAVAPDGSIYIAEQNGHLHALTPQADGVRERWVSDLGTQDHLAGSPALAASGAIYVTVGNRIVALADRGTRVEVRWYFDIASGTEVSAAVGRDGIAVFGTDDDFEYGLDADGNELWRYPRNSLSFSSPAVTDGGRAYFGDHNGYMNVVDAESGCLLQRYQGGSEVWTAPAIDAQGRVYFGTKTGHVLGFTFAGEKLFDLDTDAIVSSYPTLTGDGMLLIGSASGTLYALHD